MRVSEYIDQYIEHAFPREFKEHKQDLIKYLNKQDNDLSIYYHTIGMDDLDLLMRVKDDPQAVREMKLLQFGDNITTYALTKDFVSLLKDNMSYKVSELSIPVELFETLNLNLYKNLKKIKVTGGYAKLSENRMKSLSTKGVKEIVGYFKFSDDIKKKCIVINGGSTILYNGMVITNGHELSCLNSVYTSDILGDLDKIIAYLRSINYDMHDLSITNDINNSSFSSGNLTYYKSTTKSEGKEEWILSIKRLTDFRLYKQYIEILERNGLPVDKILLEIDNRSYNNLEELKKLEKKYKVGIRYKGSFETISVDDFVTMRATVDYFVNLINSRNLSPFEKLIYAYDIIKSFEYQEVGENEDKMISRSIHSIVRDGKIVCVGFSVFLAQLLSELGMDTYVLHTSVPRDGKVFGHERVMVHIVDEKYGIDGFYALDPTWDCAKNLLRCITKDGEEVLKMRSKLEESDTVLRAYSNLSLYRYFMVPGSRYPMVFENEPMPDLNKENCYSIYEEYCSAEEANQEFLTAKTIKRTTFLKALERVRLVEGFNLENLPEAMDEVMEINNLRPRRVKEQESFKR